MEWWQSRMNHEQQPFSCEPWYVLRCSWLDTAHTPSIYNWLLKTEVACWRPCWSNSRAGDLVRIPRAAWPLHRERICRATEPVLPRPPANLISHASHPPARNVHSQSWIFFNYTVQLRHSQCTHTHLYKYTKANPTSMSIFEDWADKSSRLMKSP
jgi:hypothetical protein